MFTKKMVCLAVLSVLVALVFSAAQARADTISWAERNLNTQSGFTLPSDLLQTNVSTSTGSLAIWTDGSNNSPTLPGPNEYNGDTAIYNLNVAVNTSGYDITSVAMYASHGNDGWAWPGADISFQLMDNTWTTSRSLHLSAAFRGANGVFSVPVETQTSLALAPTVSGVKAVKFAFSDWQLNNGAGVFELDAIGSPSAPVPEPSTLILLGTGLLGLLARRRRRA